MKKKIVTILGARPQFIKAATVSRAFAKYNDTLEELIIHTGQHYDYKMSDLFFEELSIPKPHLNLAVGSGSHGEQTGEMLKLIERELIEIKPSMVLVYGDTNSTLAGALAASKIHIPVAHVEAGLRSFNKRMPEEINRILTDHVSDLLFGPTDVSIVNLRNEGIEGKKVYNPGDVMYDAIRFYQSTAEKRSSIIKDLGVEKKNFILTTIHRAENTDDPAKLKTIMSSLNKVAETKTVIFPIHPRTKGVLKDVYQSLLNPGFRLIDPVGYLDMIALQKNCSLVVTDSGGVQKEAFLNNKFCLTVRNETEWTELVDHGSNFLINPIDILPGMVERVWDKKFENKGFQPYGDGFAADKIVEVIKEYV
jgi:UDP-GlcNAc3NAcA epimerase